MLHSYEPVRALCGSEARFRLVKALYEDPARSYHLRGLAAAAAVDPSQALRVLREWVRAGLCKETADVPARKYQAVMAHPLAAALAETFAPAGVPQETEPEVDLAQAPVLRSLLWSGRERTRIPAREAFRHYESNWRFIREADMDAREKRLFERLKRRYGRGLINA